MSVTSTPAQHASRPRSDPPPEAPLDAHHRSAPAARLHRPAGHVGQPRHQPVRAADRRALSPPRPGRSGWRSRPSSSAAASAHCCSAPRRCSAHTTGAPAMVVAPRLARSPRLGAADGAQHRAEHRLGDDGDHRHLHRRRRGRRRRLALAVRDLGRRGRHDDGGATAGQRPAAAQGHGLAGAGRLGVLVRPGAACSRASRSRRRRCSASGRLSILPWPASSPSRRWPPTTAGTRGPARPPSGALRSATASRRSPTTRSASSPWPTSAPAT